MTKENRFKMSADQIIMILNSLPSLYPNMQDLEIDAVNEAIERLKLLEVKMY